MKMEPKRLQDENGAKCFFVFFVSAEDETKSTPSKMLWLHSHVLQHKLVILTKYVF